MSARRLGASGGKLGFDLIVRAALTRTHRSPAGLEDNTYPHVIVRAALAHAQFATIHPFRDGNGCTGSMLIPLMLATEGFPPMVVSGPLYCNRHNNFDVLLEVELRSRCDAWIEFFTQAVMIGCDDPMALAAQLVALRDDRNRHIADHRTESANRKLVAGLTGTPVVTVNQVKRLLGVSFPAANHAVANLVSLGIQTGIARQRNRVFVAHEAIAVLDQAPEQRRGPFLNGPRWGQAAAETLAGKRMVQGMISARGAMATGDAAISTQYGSSALSTVRGFGTHESSAEPFKNKRARFCRSLYNHLVYFDSLTI